MIPDDDIDKIAFPELAEAEEELKPLTQKGQSKQQEKPVECKVFIIKTIPASEIIGDDSTDMCETEKDIKTFLRDKKFIDAKQSSVIFKTKAGGHEYICTLITIFYQNKDS